jgi:hypothetical protein
MWPGKGVLYQMKKRARAPRPPLHTQQLPGVEGVGEGGAVAGAPHRFARCYCVFLPSPAAQRLSAQAAFAGCSFCCSLAPGGRLTGSTFFVPSPFQGNAFCSGHLPRPLSHPLRYHRHAAAAAASPEPGGGRAAAHGRRRRRRARGRGRTGVGGPERAGARDEAIFRRRELAFPSSRWAAVFLRVRARRQQRA